MRIHAYIDPPPAIYRRPRGATDPCQPRGLFHQPAAFTEATTAHAVAATARSTNARAATIAAARRAAATPSDVGTNAHDSPSIHPDEMSDGWNSDFEEEFYTSPRADGVSDSHDGDTLVSGGSAVDGADAATVDDGEAELCARLDADDASHVPFICPSCSMHLRMEGERLTDALQNAVTCVRCPSCNSIFDVEPDGTVHSDAMPTPNDEQPISTAHPAKPPELLRKDLVWTPWPEDSLFISISIITTGGSAPRVLSIAAEVADPYHLLGAEAAGTASNVFQQYVQLPEHCPVNAAALQAAHGLDLEAVRADATSNFKGVASQFIDWLVALFDRVSSEAARAATTSPAAAAALPSWCLATWGGLALHAYELFATELASVGLRLPDGGRLLDLARVAGPKKLYPKGGSALVELPVIAEHVLSARREALSSTANGREAAQAASTLGPIQGCRRGDPTAEPLLLSVLLHELVARGTVRVGDLPPVRGRAGYATDLTPFLEYGAQRAAWEATSKKDTVPEVWEVCSAPLEQPKGLPFCAKPGCAARGGPSAKLLAACGLSEEERQSEAKTAPATDNAKGRPNAAAEELILNIFNFFFATPSADGEGESALEMMVSATNAKAAELVVKEAKNGAFRASTDEDDRDKLSYAQPGQHARYRSPALVSRPVTVAEMRVFLGLRFIMGVRNPTKLDHCWCASEDSEELRLPKVADSMTLDRFKAILSNLSFLKPDSTEWLDDPLYAKIRKFKVHL